MSGAKKLMGTTAVGGDLLAIEDVFSTYLYTGNGSTQTITNGIDLAGEGGLLWIKNRTNHANSGNNLHLLFDTDRGTDKYLFSHLTNAEVTSSALLSSFNADGFTLNTGAASNESGVSFASWTFRKAPRFFDVVTWTGNGVNGGRQISHNLGIAPGCVIIKRLDSTSNWGVFHRSLPDDSANEAASLLLNTTDAIGGYGWFREKDEQTDAYFTVRNASTANTLNATYVAYLFAHDPLGPSGDGSDGLIACGSYTNSSTNDVYVDLGWEPQWVLVKNTTDAGSWNIVDNMRGLVADETNNQSKELNPNLSDAETSIRVIQPTPTGFYVQNSIDGDYNSGNATGTRTHIYIAIRRGPMRQPTSGTEVFAVSTRDSTPPQHQAGFPVDMVLEKPTIFTGDGTFNGARLIGERYLFTNTTAAEVSNTISAAFDYDYMDGWRSGTIAYSFFYSWMFRRAPGFFDVVAYTGDGVAGRTVPHNLGVAPEMMIVKRRDTTGSWYVYVQSLTALNNLRLHATTGAASDGNVLWNSADPTDTVFTLGSNANVNASGGTYIAYLFATLPGVSKVGSYTGNGSSQTINCGFTTGARFILIKRTDSTGDWYIWDTARGIVAANDPHLSLNTSAAQVTTDDSIDPDNSGFIVNQVAATNINVSSASYIYLAIA